jgi:prophage regulatory protein
MPQHILIRLPEVLRRTGESRTQWYRKVQMGVAPKPVPLGLRAVAWVEREVDDYNATKIAKRDATDRRAA